MQGVSVYIPVSGPSKALKYCLDGLLAQSRVPDEIILIHDGTFDRIKAIAGHYAHHVRLIQLTEKLGRAFAKNVALHSAKYDLVASLHANCIPQKNWLKNLVTQMRKHTNLIGAGGPLHEIHTDSLTNQYRCIHLNRNQGNDIIVNPNILHGGNTIYRRRSVLAIGGYNNELRNDEEEIELSNRIREFGGSLIYEPKAAAYRYRRDSIASILDLQWKSFRQSRSFIQSPHNVADVWHNTQEMLKTIWKDQVVKDFLEKRYLLTTLGLASMMVVPFIEWKWYRNSPQCAIPNKPVKPGRHDSSPG